MQINPSHRLDNVTTYYFAKKLAEIATMNENGRDIINLGIGSPDLPPSKAVIDVLLQSASNPAAHKYQSYKGIPALREAYRDWYKRHFDVNISAESDILPLLGSKEGIMHISMAYLDGGDQVLIPNPGYPAYSACASLAGAKSVYYDLTAANKWLPDLNAIRNTDLSKVKMMWVNYPHMPTGAKANLEFFAALIDFGKENGILICHDNPYTFILNEEPLSILQAQEAMEYSIELTSLSKSYNMAGWRVGALVGKKEIIDTVLKFKSNMDSGMFLPIQEAAITALGQSDTWMSDLNKVYGKRREIALEILTILGAKYNKDSSGLFVWGHMDQKSENIEFTCDEILYGANVFITPGSIFGNAGNGHIRISLCADEQLLKEALKRIIQWKK